MSRQSRRRFSAVALQIVAAIGTFLIVSCSKNVTGPDHGSRITWNAVRNYPSAAGDWLLVNPIGDTELQDLQSKPESFHRALVEHVLSVKGTPPEDQATILNDLFQESSGSVSNSLPRRASATALASCDQPVEYGTFVHGTTFAYSVSSWSSPNGLEYTFYFWPGWTDSPDNIRWASTVGWVTYCIQVRSLFSSGGIAGHHLCDRAYQLQLGDGVMKVIGFGFRDTGVRATFAALYIHHT